ncbi:MAG TPA: sugar transferase [Solirubrobacteraceae bacterium]|nr:sugar transferase [Solirubrobacteraceae bacterium]
MSSVKPIEADRTPGALLEGGVGAARGVAGELVEAMDDRTRALLARARRARRSRLVPPSLVLADLLGLSLAYYLAAILAGDHGALGSSGELLIFVLTLPCWVLVAKLHGLYRRDHERTDHSTTDEVVGIFHLVTIGAWILLAASRLAGRTTPGIYPLIAFWAIAVLVLPVTRALAREACRRSGAYVQNAVIIGAGEIGQLIARKFVKHPEYGINVVGFVDRDPRARRADLPEHFTVLGPPERLPDIIQSLDVERAVIAFCHDSVPELLTLVRQLRGLPIHIDLVPRLFELMDPRVALYSVEGIPLLGLPPTRAAAVPRMIKRTIDLAGACLALVALAPLFAYIALRIRLESDGPIMFRQTRLGMNMKQFTALKFRTMKVDTDQAAHRDYIRATMTSDAADIGLYKLDREDAITKCGRWLRRTSLDELPQLINVLRGEMSLVGPRPCIPYEIENYERHHFERFAVPQGITGLWQVTARANCTYGEALDMDVAYVRGWSVGLDLRLLMRTPLQVFHQRRSTR